MSILYDKTIEQVNNLTPIIQYLNKVLQLHLAKEDKTSPNSYLLSKKACSESFTSIKALFDKNTEIDLKEHLPAPV